MRLKDKVAIVTGSTSGMGRAIAELFAREGAKVVVTGRNEDRAKEVVDAIKAEGNEAIYVIADTANVEESQVIFDKTIEVYGTVDVLVNNAGRLNVDFSQTVTFDDWDKTFNVNVTSALYLTKLATPLMKANGHGIIINVSSIAGLAGHHGGVAYTSSKHAMNGLTKSLALELGPEIRVNAIAPGAIHTAMIDEAGGVDSPAIQAMKDAAPLKRVGTPDEIATVALFLATEDSSFVTGQVLRVDGGFDV